MIICTCGREAARRGPNSPPVCEGCDTPADSCTCLPIIDEWHAVLLCLCDTCHSLRPPTMTGNEWGIMS